MGGSLSPGQPHFELRRRGGEGTEVGVCERVKETERDRGRKRKREHSQSPLFPSLSLISFVYVRS